MIAAQEQLRMDEASQLLGLSGIPPFDPAVVEQAYVAQVRTWTLRNNFVGAHEHRDRVNDALDLLKRAKKLCLASSAAPAAPAATPSVQPWTTSSKPKVIRPTPSTVNIRKSAMQLKSLTVSFWNFLKGTARFLLDLHQALWEVVRILRYVVEEISSAGVPKPVVILALIIASMLVLHSCGRVIGNISHLTAK
jgi:hypothetical protein